MNTNLIGLLSWFFFSSSQFVLPSSPISFAHRKCSSLGCHVENNYRPMKPIARVLSHYLGLDFFQNGLYLLIMISWRRFMTSSSYRDKNQLVGKTLSLLAGVKKMLTILLDVYNCVFQFTGHVHREAATAHSGEESADPRLFKSLACGPAF